MKVKPFCKLAAVVCLLALLVTPVSAVSCIIQPVYEEENSYVAKIPDNVTMILAAYDEHGKMVSASVVHTAGTKTDTIIADFSLPDAASFKAFFLTAGSTPLEAQAKAQWSTTPYRRGSYETEIDLN